MTCEHNTMMDHLESSAFTSKIEGLMQQWHIPALAIAITHGDHVSTKAFGHASLDPPRPCTPHTLFDIASASKSLTAASLALLVADNDKHPEVQWDTPVSKLLPGEFVLAEQSYTDGVTLADIVSHRSGLPGHDFQGMGISSSQPDTIQSLTQSLRYLPLAAPIRTKFMYSNLMYTVSTYLVEKLSNLSFVEFLQRHFFKPLNMSSTCLQPSQVISLGLEDRLAVPYSWDATKNTFRALPHLETPEAQGAGSIFTSVSDYILWIRAIMLQQAPITKEIHDDLLTPRMLHNPTTTLDDLDPQTSYTMYAAGWEVRSYRGVQIFEHGGLTTGFGSTHFFLPQYKFGAVILGTAGDATDVARIVHHLLIDELLGVPEDQRPDWNGIYRKLNDSFDVDEPVAKIKEDYLGAERDNEPQTLPLAAYTGNYWNRGYRTLSIVVNKDALFIDASDRSMPITIRLEHVCEQTKYLARLHDYSDAQFDVVRAEFEIEDGVATLFGIKLEEDWDNLIWFQRQTGTTCSSDSRSSGL